jgi:hypothetical protein
MRRLARFLDWRFLFSLALLLLVAYLVFAGVEAARDNRAKGERIDVLVAELQRQHADAEADRRAAAAERAELLAGQHELEQQYSVLISRQSALLAWLREEGIEVPPRFDLPAATDPSASSVPRPAPRRPPATGPALPPSAGPSTAGKSGKAPKGQAKRKTRGIHRR